MVSLAPVAAPGEAMLAQASFPLNYEGVRVVSGGGVLFDTEPG